MRFRNDFYYYKHVLVLEGKERNQPKPLVEGIDEISIEFCVHDVQVQLRKRGEQERP